MAENVGSKWWSKDTVAVVTGSNRGIGFEILHQLAKEGITVVMTDAVSDESMQASVAALKAKLQSGSSGLDSNSADIFYHRVDIRSDKSVEELASWLKEKFGSIDILVKNAGICRRELSYEVAKDTLETNFWGPKRVTDAISPLLRQTSPGGARIVTVTSRGGLYERLNHESVKDKLRDVEHLSQEILDNIAWKYLEDVKADRLEEEGWIPSSGFFPIYSVSKILLSAYTQMLGLRVLTKGEPGSILVSTMCPGATDTPMMDEETKKNVPNTGFTLKTAEEGADTAVWLALLPKEDYPHNKLFAERQEYPYHLKLSFTK